jgi:hypothetical protein
MKTPKHPVLKICIAIDVVWWVIAILVVVTAGCATPIFSAAGDLGPVRYRVGVAYAVAQPLQ